MSPTDSPARPATGSGPTGSAGNLGPHRHREQLTTARRVVVKIGSRMIDGSIRTKLNSLAQAMKG